MASHRRGFTAVAVTLGLALATSGFWLAPSSGFTPTVATTTVAGQTVVDGEVPKHVRDAAFDVSGTSSTAMPLSIDAGDSTFTEVGQPAALEAIASSGTAPYTFSWSIAGSSAGFSPADRAKTFLDTTGLQPGAITAQVVVTDQKGATATDTVKLVVWAPVVEVILDETVAVGPGVPDEDAIGLGIDNSGVVDGETHRFPFTIGENTSDLDLELTWTIHEPDPLGVAPVTLNDFDLYVHDPSGAEDDNVNGATAGRPERLEISDPAAGDWEAQVNAFLSTDDTFHLTATTTIETPNPLPTISTASPFRFAPDETQLLTATATGAAPLAMQWDLDLDGSWDATGNEVIAAYPLGTHLAVVKVTDANGFEERQMVGVRVVSGDAVVAPMVVVAVNDTGVNLYHDDFNARAFPDPAVLAATDNFTRHPSEYIPGFPADMPALPISHDAGYYPAKDHALFDPIDVGDTVWVPGTKVIAARDGGNTDETDLIPILDDEFVPASPVDAGPGHGTASASVAVGNQYGNCPTCLLVFTEDINGAWEWVYDQPWIDIVSNSFGTQSNIGSAGGVVPFFSFTDGMPKAAAERGQLGLFASGNGNENGFITPQQTYTSDLSGPGWVMRVGAAATGTRKPIVGDGMPVDVTSFGSGDIPAASYKGTDLNNDTQGHSGTSAATPLTAGVFGHVLREARRAVGDQGAGQRAEAVIAKGNPVAGSSYLGDGELTATELREVVLKTTEHDDSLDSIGIFPVQTPNNPAQFAIEGYGLADKASAERAIAVLLGAALPERPAEDAFFAADYALRVALWGEWAGGGENSGDSSTSSASLRPNPFTGVRPEQVLDIDDALALVLAHAAPSATASAGPGTEAETGTLTATVTSPAAGTVVDPRLTPSLQVAGSSTFPPFPSAPTRLWPRRDACGAASEQGAPPPNPRLERRDGPDGVTCGYIPAAPALSPVIGALSDDFPLITGDLPLTLGAGSVSGVLYYEGEVPSPLATIHVQLLTKVGGNDQVIGEQTIDKTVIGFPVEPVVPFAFSFPVPSEFEGRTLGSLILRIEQRNAQGSLFLELDDPASYVDVPEVQVQTRRIEVTLDDETFTSPAPVTPAADGSWSLDLPISDLPDGTHTVRARAVQGTEVSPVSSSTITSKRSAGVPAAQPVQVQVQVVKRGASPVATGWTEAADTSGAGDLSTWTARVLVPKAGKYDLYSRVVLKGTEAARNGPARFSRTGNG